MPIQTLLTVEEFEQLPKDGYANYELVDGELVKTSSGTFTHNRMRDKMVGRFDRFLSNNPLGAAVGEVDVRTGPRSVRKPDVSFWRREKLAQFDRNKVPVTVPPDIAAEVISATELATDVNDKVLEYLDAGVCEVWLVFMTSGEIHVRRSSNSIRVWRAGEELQSEMLPGFSLPLEELFREASL
ncbi:MAG: Uma2 family endonuclease [Bryobacteraceae bacterium]